MVSIEDVQRKLWLWVNADGDSKLPLKYIRVPVKGGLRDFLATPSN